MPEDDRTEIRLTRRSLRSIWKAIRRYRELNCAALPKEDFQDEFAHRVANVISVCDLLLALHKEGKQPVERPTTSFEKAPQHVSLKLTNQEIRAVDAEIARFKELQAARVGDSKPVTNIFSDATYDAKQIALPKEGREPIDYFRESFEAVYRATDILEEAIRRQYRAYPPYPGIPPDSGGIIRLIWQLERKRYETAQRRRRGTPD